MKRTVCILLAVLTFVTSALTLASCTVSKSTSDVFLQIAGGVQELDPSHIEILYRACDIKDYEEKTGTQHISAIMNITWGEANTVTVIKYSGEHSSQEASKHLQNTLGNVHTCKGSCLILSESKENVNTVLNATSSEAPALFLSVLNNLEKRANSTVELIYQKHRLEKIAAENNVDNVTGAMKIKIKNSETSDWNDLPLEISRSYEVLVLGFASKSEAKHASNQVNTFGASFTHEEDGLLISETQEAIEYILCE